MICDCPACGAALMFDPQTGKMKCDSCGSTYETYELHETYEKENRWEADSSVDIQESRSETKDLDDKMECSIYTCTACGAEIAVNDVEVSTFCAYCGQPTVVFNRVSSTKKPRYIIPFSVTRNRAISLIRNRLSRGFFVPGEIKNFEIERVRGIYIPFWLYDLHYSDREYLSGVVKSGKTSTTYYYFREAECDFSRLTLDASMQLNDESSQRLEPYHMDGLTDFRVEYLSGFYADCYDMDTAEMDGLAVWRARNMFEKEVQKTISANHITVLKRDPAHKITKTEYAMFPAWFLTFRYEDVPYTLLVNGQTEKIIGAVPYDKGKMKICFTTLGAVFSIVATWIFYIALYDLDADSYKVIFILLFGGAMALWGGLDIMNRVKTSTELTGLAATNRFVKERQEGD